MTLFGTDGVRGVANEELTGEFALRLGRAASAWLQHRGGNRVVIGRDTRRSGPMLEAALAAGFASRGVEVTSLGIAPTPAVSFAAREGQFHLAAVVSASHNPAKDNGIKFLGPDGAKLSQSDEQEIETAFHRNSFPRAADVGWVRNDATLLSSYSDWLCSIAREKLDGLRIAVDCANGAACEIAPEVLKRLGATTICVGIEPDGDNINYNCGATCPECISQLVADNKCHIGVAFDGDADRCVFSDENGDLVNGDRVMACWALDQITRGALEPKTVVATVMSNLGFEQALREHGIAVERTPVGDRHIAERMKQLGAKIGGEQSGHIIFSDFAPTGDGLVTMIQMLSVLKRSRIPASQIPPRFENWPQAMVNVHVENKNGWEKNDAISKALSASERALTGRGRILVRASGTQPMIRVMVESQDRELRDRLLEDMVETITNELGGRPANKVELTNALGD